MVFFFAPPRKNSHYLFISPAPTGEEKQAMGAERSGAKKRASKAYGVGGKDIRLREPFLVFGIVLREGEVAKKFVSCAFLLVFGVWVGLGVEYCLMVRIFCGRQETGY